MTNSTEGMVMPLVLLLTIFSVHLNAQTSAYHPNRILISFKSNVNELEIDALQNAYTADEIHRFPETDIRVWEIPSFPVNFVYQNQNVRLININTVNQSAMQQAEVEGADYDYLLEAYLDFSEGGGNRGGSFDCNGIYSTFDKAGNNTTKLSIVDTGYSPNDSDDGTDMYFELGNFSGLNYINNTSDFTDDNDHGTHIASIVNHVSHSASFIEPSESNTQYYIQKSFDDTGNAYLSDVIEAIDGSILKGINILNFSFSYRGEEPLPGEISPMQRALLDAEEANILVVAAAGNDFGIDNDQAVFKSYPASFDYPNILSVASVGCNGNLSAFSNFGKKTIDIAAPGEFIEGASPEDGIINLSGTSQATAIVSGVANMLASNLDVFEYEKVKCAILAGAQYNPALVDKILTSGVLHAQNALAILDNCNSNTHPIGNSDYIVPLQSNDQQTVNVFPNPVSNHIKVNIVLEEGGPVQLRLLDYTGKVLLKNEHFAEKGSFDVEMRIDQSISNGIYVLHLNTPNAQLKTRLIILK